MDCNRYCQGLQCGDDRDCRWHDTAFLNGQFWQGPWSAHRSLACLASALSCWLRSNRQLSLPTGALVNPWSSDWSMIQSKLFSGSILWIRSREATLTMGACKKIRISCLLSRSPPIIRRFCPMDLNAYRLGWSTSWDSFIQKLHLFNFINGQVHYITRRSDSFIVFK